MLVESLLLFTLIKSNLVDSSTNKLYQVTVTQPLVELDPSKVSTFKHKLSSDFSNLQLIEGALYLTGNDYVFCLNSSNITCTDAYCGYNEKHIKPTTIHTNENNNVNFVKFLAYRESVADLIVCCTNKGKPIVYDLIKSDLSEKSQEYNGYLICPGVGDLKSLNLIATSAIGPKALTAAAVGIEFMYSALWINQLSNQEEIFSRYGIYRNMIKVGKYSVFSVFSPHWLWEPSFISIDMDDKYVYYFFTEFSVEAFSKVQTPERSHLLNKPFNRLSDYTAKHSTSLTRYARVARVCKNDIGIGASERNRVWSTFRKTRLKCDCAGDHMMPDYGHGFSVEFDELVLIKRLRGADDEDTLLGVFRLVLSDGAVHSVLCEFSSGMIRTELEKRRFWSFNKTVADTFLDDKFDCDQEFLSSLKPTEVEGYVSLLSQRTILDTVVSGECRLVLPYDIRAFDSMQEGATTMVLLLMSSGKILRVRADDYTVPIVLDLSHLIQPGQQINELLTNESTRMLYISTSESVLQISLLEIAELVCGNFTSCTSCLRDPLCTWNMQTGSCASKLADSSITQKEENCGLDSGPFQSLFGQHDLNVTVVEQSGSLVLHCSKALFDWNQRLGLGPSLLARHISWYRSNVRLDKEDFCRVTSHGELVLFGLQRSHSGTIVCKYMNQTVRQVNLHVVEERHGEVSVARLESMFEHWILDIAGYKNKLDEHYSNCTLN